MTLRALRHALLTAPLEPGQTRPMVFFVDGEDAGNALNLLKRLLVAAGHEDSIPGTMTCAPPLQSTLRRHALL